MILMYLCMEKTNTHALNFSLIIRISKHLNNFHYGFGVNVLPFACTRNDKFSQAFSLNESPSPP